MRADCQRVPKTLSWTNSKGKKYTVVPAHDIAYAQSMVFFCTQPLLSSPDSRRTPTTFDRMLAAECVKIMSVPKSWQRLHR